MTEDGTRRARARARLAELGDEPGGEEFLARMGALGDWIVDFAFGDVHARPGLDARERELIIVAVLTTLGSSDPQVRAHIRALRAIDVPWNEIEEAILQTTPYAGIPRTVNAMKVLRDEQEASA
jgi:4-carboxymuconolactone decarboxylase